MTIIIIILIILTNRIRSQRTLIEIQRSLLQAAKLLPCFDKLVFADATDMAPPTLPLVAAAGLRTDLKDWVVSLITEPLVTLEIELAESDMFFF